jgi:hypothetical protein
MYWNALVDGWASDGYRLHYLEVILHWANVIGTKLGRAPNSQWANGGKPTIPQSAV